MKAPPPLLPIYSANNGAIAGAGTFSLGPLNVAPYIGGILVGTFEISANHASNVLKVTQSRTSNPSPGGGLIYNVSRDTTVASGIIYPFMITIFNEWVKFDFTNGASAQTFSILDVRARAQGL